MASSLARSSGNSVKWLVSVALIMVIWRIGVYGVDWKSRNSVLALLATIAVLAYYVTIWKPWKRRS